MTKIPPFSPTVGLRRLADVTATASARITKLEADVEWYKHALEEKHAWARREEQRARRAERNLHCLYTFLALCLLLYGATELGSR